LLSSCDQRRVSIRTTKRGKLRFALTPNFFSSDRHFAMTGMASECVCKLSLSMRFVAAFEVFQPFPLCRPLFHDGSCDLSTTPIIDKVSFMPPDKKASCFFAQVFSPLNAYLFWSHLKEITHREQTFLTFSNSSSEFFYPVDACSFPLSR